MKFLFLSLSCFCALSGSTRGTRVKAGMRPLYCPYSAGLCGGLGAERPKAMMVRTRDQGLGKGWGESQTDRQTVLGSREGLSKTRSEADWAMAAERWQQHQMERVPAEAKAYFMPSPSGWGLGHCTGHGGRSWSFPGAALKLPSPAAGGSQALRPAFQRRSRQAAAERPSRNSTEARQGSEALAGGP